MPAKIAAIPARPAPVIPPTKVGAAACELEVETPPVGAMVVVVLIVEVEAGTEGTGVETPLEVGDVETVLEIGELETTLKVVETFDEAVVEERLSEEEVEGTSVVAGVELSSEETEGRRLLRIPPISVAVAVEVSLEVVFAVGSVTSTSQQCPHVDEVESQEQ